MSEERLSAIARGSGMPLPLVRAWCEVDWAPELRRWLETAPAGEVAAWIEANARETELVGEDGLPQ